MHQHGDLCKDPCFHIWCTNIPLLELSFPWVNNFNIKPQQTTPPIATKCITLQSETIPNLWVTRVPVWHYVTNLNIRPLEKCQQSSDKYQACRGVPAKFWTVHYSKSSYCILKRQNFLNISPTSQLSSLKRLPSGDMNRLFEMRKGCDKEELKYYKEAFICLLVWGLMLSYPMGWCINQFNPHLRGVVATPLQFFPGRSTC